MVLSEWFYYDSRFYEWLWLMPNSIIVPHYSERDWDAKKDDYQSKIKDITVLWIDELTFVEYEDWKIGDTYWRWNAYLFKD